MSAHLSVDKPSSWVRRFSGLIESGGEVLDLACGGGRHSRLLLEQGFRVLALDRDGDALQSLARQGIATLQCDLEQHAPGLAATVWPFAAGRFQGVVVTNYLHRPLLPLIANSLAPGGILIYETFALGNERFGKPSNPDFLLRPGELLQWLASDGGPDLRVIAFEDGYLDQPKPAMVQRLCAIKGSTDIAPERLRLI